MTATSAVLHGEEAREQEHEQQDDEEDQQNDDGGGVSGLIHVGGLLWRDGATPRPVPLVMTGLVPVIHVDPLRDEKRERSAAPLLHTPMTRHGVEARDKRGHDGSSSAARGIGPRASAKR